MHFAAFQYAFRVDTLVCVMHTIRMMQSSLDLTAIRAALKLTQADLANMAKVNVATIWRWENEGVPERGPARAFIERLAEDAKRAKAGAAA